MDTVKDSFIKLSPNVDWKFQGLVSLLETISNPSFPCYFAKEAVERNTLFFGFYEHETLSETSDYIKQDISDFLKLEKEKKQGSGDLDPYWVLIIGLKTNHKTLKEDHELAGDILLNIAGCKVEDIYKKGWVLDYQGAKLFMNVNSRHHKLRKSRNLGQPLYLVIQGFDALVETCTTPVREAINKRVDRYDELPHSEALPMYEGENDKSDWQQYFLTESNDVIEKFPHHGKE